MSVAVIHEGFIKKTAWLMRRWFGADLDEAMSAGTLALLQAAADGEATSDAISSAAKRYIRREMARASAPAAVVKMTNLVDYKYLDGRTCHRGPKRAPKDKFARRRQRNLARGLCPICGVPLTNGLRLCDRCRMKRKLRRLLRMDRTRQQQRISSRRSETRSLIFAGEVCSMNKRGDDA